MNTTRRTYSFSKQVVSKSAAKWVDRRAAGLTPAEEAELAAWLAADARHRDAFDRSSSVWSLMERPHETGCADMMVSQLADRRRKRVRRRIVGTGTAALATLALLTVADHRRRGAPTPAELTVRSTAVLTEVRRHALPDGSLVEFKADAQVATHFTPSERRVRLVRGETHFQVSPDASRPFLVVANGVEVRAVGTAFAVRLDEQSVNILVTEGRVAVAPQAAENGPERPEITDQRQETAGPEGRMPDVGGQNAASRAAEPVYVTAGRRAVVSVVASAPGIQVTDVNPAEQERSLAWRHPRLEFSATRLLEAVELFNTRATGWDPIALRVGDPELADLEVSGFFRTDNVEGFVRLLEGSFGVTAERTSGFEIVLRRAR